MTIADNDKLYIIYISNWYRDVEINFYLRWKREQLLFSLLVETCGTLVLLFLVKMFRQTLIYFLHQHEYDEDSDCDDDDLQLCLCRLIKKKNRFQFIIYIF